MDRMEEQLCLFAPLVSGVLGRSAARSAALPFFAIAESIVRRSQRVARLWRVGPRRGGSNRELFKRAGSYRSGQTGQTVNLMAYAFAGSNPALPSETSE